MVEQLWQRQILCASAPSAAPHCGAAAAAASEAATSSARARGGLLQGLFLLFRLGGDGILTHRTT